MRWLIAAVTALFVSSTVQAQEFGPPELIEKAKAEGRIFFYSVNFSETEQAWIAAFNKRFPFVKVELTRAPGDQAVQLKVYGFAAQSHFAENGREPEVSIAEYISFGDDGNAVQSIAEKNSTVAQAVQVGAQAFAQHVTRIEAGEFPPEPDNAGLCEWCAFTFVCRRESVTEKGDEGGAVEA